MKINLQILDSSYIYAPINIEELNTKKLVPKMVTRRRLTRAAKIAIYLADKVNFNQGRIVYGNSYGEPLSTTKILNSINDKEHISPTVFQNSVYNTAVSYLSMLTNNKSEIMTISSGNNTSLNILKAGAIKALDGDSILLLATETINIEKIEELNNCIDFLECGVALKVKLTTQDKTINFSKKNEKRFPASLAEMVHIANNVNDNKLNIIEINI